MEMVCNFKRFVRPVTISKEKVHQILTCSPVILAQLMIGVAYGWLAPTLLQLRSVDGPFSINTNEMSWLASSNDVGKIFGTLMSPLLVDKIGRKYTLILISIAYFALWSSIIVIRNIYLLCMARILIGLTIGVNDVVAGIYTTENCSATFRGIIGSVTQVVFFGGIFLENVIASYSSYTVTSITNSAMAACAFATLYFSTETPYFLIMKGKSTQAEKSLIWLSGGVGGVSVDEELQKIKRNVLEEKRKTQSLKLLLLSPANLKGIILVVSMYILIVATGFPAVDAYATQIFVPDGKFNVKNYTVLYGGAQFIAVMILPLIIEKVNRRSLVIGGFCGIAISNICATVLIYSQTNGYEIMFYPWLIFAAVCGFGMFGSVAASGLYTLKGELLPFSVRAIGSSMAVVGFSLSSFFVIKTFPLVADIFGMSMNFLVYSIISLLTVIFLFYALPETRGKALHELQNGQTVEFDMEKISCEKLETASE